MTMQALATFGIFRSHKCTMSCLALTLLSLLTCNQLAYGSSPLTKADFTVLGYANPKHPDQAVSESDKQIFCKQLNESFSRLGWDPQPCGDVPWQIGGKTSSGHPLLYWVYGKGAQTTLLISGVHPDEFTPVPMGFMLAKHLLSNPSAINPNLYRVVIAPLANPDGFLIDTPTRTNANGIDVNRNFFTKDWYKKAIFNWRHNRSRIPRRFPGFFPNSEIETIFQAQLIKDFAPDKILSIHAPLGFLDYDGPGDRIKAPRLKYERQAKELAHAISEKTRNYRIVDYSFYPGSLGNYAGNEHDIPTVTLELETTNPKKVSDYWQQHLPGMLQCIVYPYARLASATTNSSKIQ